MGEYDLAAEIAAGGMGVVYLARRAGDRIGEAYAVKLIHGDLIERFPEMGERLRKEARLACQVHHPGAVGVVEVGQHESRPYVVMPYVEGGTLADLLAAGQAAPGVVAAILIDALRGLHAAHAAEDERGLPLRLVHRDVCPENVLVGGDGRGRIADFGIAVAADETLDARRGSGRGKWAFMSPEQIRGDPLDRRSDVFSAGVTLFHALTGKELFRGPSPAGTIHNVLHMDVPRPAEVAPWVPEPLSDVCIRALARDCEARFSTAESMAAALADAARAAGLVASPADVGEAVWAAVGERLGARRRALAALASESAPRSLPLPPPGAGARDEGAAGGEEVRAAGAWADEEGEDPDGPATAPYGAGSPTTAATKLEADDEPEIEIVSGDGERMRLAAGSGEHPRAAPPASAPAGFAARAGPAGADGDRDPRAAGGAGPGARFWSRVWRAVWPPARRG